MTEKYESDKLFIEDTFLPKHLWRNPNSLNDILHDFYAKTSNKGDVSNMNSWLFTNKTERSLLQDILFMVNGVESESFKLNENRTFEKRLPIQLKHVSSETLTRVIEEFVGLANNRIEVQFNLENLSENFNTTVIEGLVECIKDFDFQYQSYVEDIQCIFLKQASQGIE